MVYDNIILLFAGFLAGIINVLSGGGSMISVPLMIFLGIDGIIANGTNRIAILVQNISAVHSFQKKESYNFRYGFKLVILPFIGSCLGALLMIKISGPVFNKILAVVLIFTLIMFFKKKKENFVFKNKFFKYIALLFAGLYGGFIQIGVGFILMFALNSFFDNLKKVNIYKVFIVMIDTVPALLIFALTSKINYQAGVILALGNYFGAKLGVKINLSNNAEKYIKIITACSVSLMVIKLIFF